MPTINGRNYSGVPGLNIRANNGVIRFETPSITPTTATGERMLYVNSSNELIFNNGSGTTVIGAGGGGSTPTWETIFASDATFTVTPDATWTIAGNRSTATDVVTITNIAGGSGSCLQFTNSGSGNDVDGSANTWSVSKAGAASFLTVTLTGTTMTSTAENVAWALKDNSATALSIGASGDTDMMVFDTSNAGPVVKFNDALTVVDGIATLISSSNTVSNLLVTNNTATTFGADADSSGVVVFRSTSLTTGSLLQLQLTEATLNGGFYLTGRDVTGGANVFTIGENGVMVMAGTAGSDSLTLTAGDVALSDGSITVTDADNAATFSITNNTATTASVAVLAGSGTFTGSTTTSFFTITPSGLTTGTAVYLPVAAMTTGKALHVVSNAITSGKTVHITGTAGNALTSGELLTLDHTSGNITGTLNKSGNLSSVTSARTVTTGTVSDDYDALLIARSSTINGAGAFTAAGSVLNLTNTVTNSSGTVADTTNGLEITMSAGGTGYGILLTHSGVLATTASAVSVVANAATTSTGVIRVSATGLTDGFVVALTGGGANFTASGGMMNLSMGAATVGAGIAVTTTGVYTGAGLLQLTANSATTGTIAVITANGLTTGTALTLTSSGTITTTGEMLSIVANSATTSTGLLRISGTGLTDGYVAEFTGGGANFTATGGMMNLSMGAATVGAGIKIATTGVYTGAGLLQLTAASATTGVIAQITANGLTTGNGLNVSSSGTITSSGSGLVVVTASGLTTGYAMQITDGGASNTLTSGSMLRVYSNSNDTTARGVVSIVQDNASATGATPILIQQDGVVSTNYRRLIKESATGITIWMGNGTTANGTLSGTAGDILINGGSNKPEYCTGTTNWTALV
jgi:fibronectin-binding autotransporter adhesin